MTPAERYIAAHYERAVDQGLDLEALRLYLLAHGIKRTPAQVRHELDEVYGFYQYADTHPAPPVLTYAELNALDDAKASKPARLLHAASVCRPAQEIRHYP